MSPKVKKTKHPKQPIFSLKALFVFIVSLALVGAVYLELTGQAANPNLPGDVNSDNVVNTTDLSILVSHYNTTDTTADLNADAKTNILDLSKLLAHYGQTYIPNPPPSGSVPKVGISVGSKIMSRNDTDARFELDQAKAVNAKVIRIDYAEWDYSRSESFVIPEIKARGMTPMLCIGGTTGPRDLSAVASRAVNLYGHSVLYETMNEPDLQGWSATQIADQVKVIGSTLKAKDPQAWLAAGALWKGDGGPVAVVREIYNRSAKPYFDAISLHMYDDPYQRGTWNQFDAAFPVGTFSAGNTVREVMDANGDSAKLIISTENGGPVPKYSEAQQATIISHDFDALNDPQFRGFGMQLVYTMMDDDVPGFGMLRPDRSQRPAWNTFKTRAAAF